MATRKAAPAASVTEYIARLGEPLRSEVEALRQVVLGVANGIGEEVKWNAPSFRMGQHFATLRLNGKVPLQIILHLGAKKSSLPQSAIDDPAGLLQWLGPDRACVGFAKPGAVAAQASALRAIVRQWVRYVPVRIED